MDLRFYHFMGALVRDNRDSIMADDNAHWEKLGLDQGFEAYVQQKREQAPYDPALRKAWIKELMAQHKAKREAAGTPDRRPSTKPRPAAATCRELLHAMPQGFSTEAADGLEAVYQFEVSGGEAFTAHLAIGGGKCAFHAGPAPAPSVVIKTPADVWLAIARGELDGQQAFMTGKYTVQGDLCTADAAQVPLPRRLTGKSFNEICGVDG